MDFLMRLFSLAVLICLNANSKAEILDDVSKEWIIQKPDTILVLDKQHIKNPQTFIYASCNSSALPKKLDCEFVLYYLNTLDGEPNNLTCAINLFSSENKSIKKNLRLESLGKDSVVFSWLESNDDQSILDIHEKVRVLHMPSCEISYSKDIEGIRKSLTIVSYDNAFDIIDHGNKSCGSICKLNYDNEKHLESYSTLPSNPNFWQLIPTNCHSSLDGYFALGGDMFRSLNVSHISHTGETKHLITLAVSQGGYSIARYSRGEFGICFNHEVDSTECVQVDIDGNKVLNQKVYHHDNDNVLSVHNVKNGLLVLVGKCKNVFDTFSCFPNKKKYSNNHIMGSKVTKDNVRTPFEIPRPDFNCKTKNRESGSGSLKIFESDDRYCFYYSVVCNEIKKEVSVRTLKFSRKCIQS